MIYYCLCDSWYVIKVHFVYFMFSHCISKGAVVLHTAQHQCRSKKNINAISPLFIQGVCVSVQTHREIKTELEGESEREREKEREGEAHYNQAIMLVELEASLFSPVAAWVRIRLFNSPNTNPRIFYHVNMEHLYITTRCGSEGLWFFSFSFNYYYSALKTGNAGESPQVLGFHLHWWHFSPPSSGYGFDSTIASWEKRARLQLRTMAVKKNQGLQNSGI